MIRLPKSLGPAKLADLIQEIAEKEVKKQTEQHKTTEKQRPQEQAQQHHAKISEQKKAPSKKVHLYTGFEPLTCPLLTSPQLTVKSLKSLSKQVELQYYQPSAYFSRGHDWEKLEPTPRPLTTPLTNPDTIQEPMDAVFEEIWCPLIAESADRLRMAPSSIQYLTDQDIVREKRL